MGSMPGRHMPFIITINTKAPHGRLSTHTANGWSGTNVAIGTQRRDMAWCPTASLSSSIPPSSGTAPGTPEGSDEHSTFRSTYR